MFVEKLILPAASLPNLRLVGLDTSVPYDKSRLGQILSDLSIHPPDKCLKIELC